MYLVLKKVYQFFTATTLNETSKLFIVGEAVASHWHLHDRDRL